MMEYLARRAMMALMPQTEALPGVSDTALTAFLHQMREETHWYFWLGIVAGTLVFTLTPLLTVGLPLPSIALPRRMLDRHAQRIATTRIYLFRQAIFLLKSTAVMCWGADPAVRGRFALQPYAPSPGTWRS